MIRIALLAVILLCLYAGPANAHYPRQPDPKGGKTLEDWHVQLHRHKGHAWAMVKHPTTYKSLVWHRKALRRINRRLAQVHFQLRAENDPKVAICQVFGPYCDQALAVARCETGGTFDVYASNGQYQGLFQVSAHWRSTVPGFAYNALAQARHAYRVFRLTGSNWSHWECKP